MIGFVSFYLIKLKKTNDAVFLNSVEENFRRTYLISLLAVVLFSILSVYFIFKVPANSEIDIIWKTGIYTTHAVMFLVFLAAFLFVHKVRKLKVAYIIMVIIQYIMIGALMVGGIVLTMYEKLVSDNITPFVLSCME